MRRQKFKIWNRKLEEKARSVDSFNVEPVPYYDSDRSKIFNKDKLKRILEGEYRFLGESFVWSQTPQGSRWAEVMYGRDDMTEKDRTYLQALLHGNVDFRKVTEEDMEHWNG